MKSFCAILDDAAAEVPDKPLFVFPETRWNPEDQLTYGGLARRSAAAAKILAEFTRPGDRALLLFPTGAAFWEAFMGCLASGVIAVPLNTPNLNRSSDLLKEVCRDCSPQVLMTDEATAELLKRRADINPDLSRLFVVTPNQWRGHESDFRFVIPDGDPVAFLQYTSGSTARPKGVQISHENLLANMSMIRDHMGLRLYVDRAITWLPHYHDMGLVGSYLTALFLRITSYCLPPQEFAIRPARLLQLISDHKVNICGGPDFGYRLCVEKINADDLSGIDLSSWRIAYVGAERIRAETLRRFTEKFSPYGFHNNSFFPCYGLGEATLMATGGPAQTLPVIRQLSSAALMANQIEPPESIEDGTSLVGCGQTFDGSSVVIVDLETGQPLADDRIGEVLLSGPSVTRGYYQRKDLNEQAFCELIHAGQPTTFLKTGDLGFLSGNELFITGRIKEIIIIRGRNLSPEDIEQRIADAHESLLQGGAVAFSVDQHGEESLIVALEIKRSALSTVSVETVVAVVRQRISEAFGINTAEILLLRPASIPRTSSGKLKRLEVRDRYLKGELEFLPHNPK